MGEHDQRRLIRKLDLERFIESVAPQSNPKVHLEQYTTSPHIASQMLYVAAYSNNDIVGKSILDLGCGTGRLAFGAAFLGARDVVAIDIDRSAIEAAHDNKKATLTKTVELVLGDIEAIDGCFDTVLQNPPFGVQNREADRAFITKALQAGKSIYSLHNHPEVDERLIGQLKSSGGFVQVAPSPFLVRFITKHGGVVLGVYAMLMTIPRLFDFHTKLRHDFVVDLYVIKKK